MQESIDTVNALVWGPLTILLLVGTGLYFTIRLRLIQVFKLALSVRMLGRLERADAAEQGSISRFSALTVALSAATVNDRKA